eukprot:4849658-Amphidinium_carterae.1
MCVRGGWLGLHKSLGQCSNIGILGASRCMLCSPSSAQKPGLPFVDEVCTLPSALPPMKPPGFKSATKSTMPMVFAHFVAR